MRTLDFRPGRLLHAVAAAACCISPAFAGVIVVDDDGGPGVDFTDLPPAVLAAQPGDVLLVQPGNYAGFSTTKGIAVVAPNGGVLVTSATRIASLPAGQTARLVGMELTTLQLVQCTGVVVLDGVRAEWNGVQLEAAVKVTSCKDLRVLDSFVGDFQPFSTLETIPDHALSVFASRVEVVASQIRGARGGNGFSGHDGENGGNALDLAGGSRVHLALTDAQGGKGGDGSIGGCFGPLIYAGHGGDAAFVREASTLFAMGTPDSSSLVAGLGGAGSVTCTVGFPGDALELQSGAFGRHSGQTIWGAVKVDPSSVLETPALLDPYLERIGVPLFGTQVRFNVYGEAGDDVTLFLGRNAVLQPLPGVLVEKLTSEERAFSLGAIPAGGFATFVFPLPSWMAPGFTFYAQARVMRGAEEFRTNSVPVVVR